MILRKGHQTPSEQNSVRQALMTQIFGRFSLTSVVFTALAFLFGLYFVFANFQGSYGLFRGIQVEAEADQLRQLQAELDAELFVMRNKTLRLSDQYLDLDLLDEQARDVLGALRSDEWVIH